MHQTLKILLIVAVAFGTLIGPPGARAQTSLSGETRIHDPSILVMDGAYVAFGTGVEDAADGGMVRALTSPDGVKWSSAGVLPGGMPSWVADTLGFVPRNAWAPSVSLLDGTASLYYSASTFGRNTSAIGLMTNPAFDATKPLVGWQDRGLVIRSSGSDSFNAIDPFRFNDLDGRSYLALGSFWDGIRLITLDPKTGKRVSGSGVVRLASRGGGAIEAPALVWRDGYYYLFVSFDACCRGTSSTYRIMVGRASKIEGPYRDKDGRALLFGGGTQVLASDGRYRGPGGQEVFANGDDELMLALHYYDRDAGGIAKLAIAPLVWSTDGWPSVDPLP